MEELEILEGWFSLHDFRTVDWARLNKLSAAEKKSVKEEFASLCASYQAIATDKKGGFGLYNVVGHKADFLMLNLRPQLENLNQVKKEFNQTAFAAYTTSVYTYISVVELSNYVVNRDQSPEIAAMIESRLKPAIPNKKYVCFYPMNKRRDGIENNWYILPVEERRRMMKAHGLVGRKYAGKVIQMIGGSIGLDDWEWGVTLFADDPLVFKHIVTEMRFDEVSAKYADFGAFTVGNQSNITDLC